MKEETGNSGLRPQHSVRLAEARWLDKKGDWDQKMGKMRIWKEFGNFRGRYSNLSRRERE